MKKRLLLYLFCLLSSFIFAQPVREHGALQVKGTQLTDAHGKSVVLRGMSFGWHNWWSQYFTAGTVDWLVKDWKCNVVRAALGVEPGNGYLDKPGWSTEKIKTVIDAAIKNNIYVIIDWHSHNIRLNEAKTFFTAMATTYGKNPHVIYELFNEPDQESWADVKSYSVELIKTIRAIDPDNIILVGCPHWDQDIQLVADDPLQGFSNIMYTFHFYAGTHKQELRDRGDYAYNKGIPIFISESAGMEASGDGPINEEEWKKWIDWAENKKISWVTWSVSSKNETCSVLQASAGTDGNWKDSDLKQSGVETRALLRQYNGK